MMMSGDGGGGGDWSEAAAFEFNEPFIITTPDSDEYLVVITEPAVFYRVSSILKLLRSKKSYQFPSTGVEVRDDAIITEYPVAWLDWEQGKIIRWFVPEVQIKPPPKIEDFFDEGDGGDGDVLA